MRNKKRLAAVFLLLAAIGAWTSAAKADHFTGVCATELNGVETAIQNGIFVGKNASTDQSNLLAKLEAAAAKVRLSKFSDAVDKLQNISDTATALAGAQKPKLEDASQINGAVVTAIGCVGAL